MSGMPKRERESGPKKAHFQGEFLHFWAPFSRNSAPFLAVLRTPFLPKQSFEHKKGGPLRAASSLTGGDNCSKFLLIHKHQLAVRKADRECVGFVDGQWLRFLS